MIYAIIGDVETDPFLEASKILGIKCDKGSYLNTHHVYSNERDVVHVFTKEDVHPSWTMHCDVVMFKNKDGITVVKN